MVGALASSLLQKSAVTSSGSEKRPFSIGEVESLSGVLIAREREPGHRRPPARKRNGSSTEVNGGRFTRARRSSSRERRAKVNASWFRFGFGPSGMRIATDGGRYSGSGKRTPFTRSPRNRSRRPSRHGRGSRHANEREGGDRSARGERNRFMSVGRERPRIGIARTPKWEARREARFSPVSFAPAGPEPSGAPHGSFSDGP